ncbi:ComEC/Rec2 family competence protein [Corynebacterium mastitidis]|uniref:ComEC/Rec2 family competence protein n=1 Tax=Corynebacterium mastitidis TaxID=161890 RepID=UPI00035E3C30|nr:ComEC/Rec2 family competence protein [Corynebacterium mastitidis]
MSELRLVPAAALTWAVALAAIHGHAPLGACLVGVVAAVCLLLGSWGQALVTGSCGAASLAVAAERVTEGRRALPGLLRATVLGEPKSLPGGSWLVRVRVPGYPAEVPLFIRGQEEPSLPRGGTLSAAVDWAGSERAGVGRWVGTVRWWEAEEPAGVHAWVNRVHEEFREAVVRHMGASSQGIAPGMVLGDTSLQAQDERAAYLASGLSHLSAVSGANVTIVATCAFLLCRLCGLGPRVQVASAGALVALFFLLVGPEPSVLRATVTGLVGLAAVARSATFPPLHALSVSVIALVLYDSDLACRWGFALSVGATAGIVACYRIFYRLCARTRLPDVVARAVAVAAAADLATAPLVAAMSGRVSLVSVCANVAVGAAVAPVTVLGLVAVAWGCLRLPGQGIPLHLMEPCTWWIHRVARYASSLPYATVEARPEWVILGYAWLLYLALALRGRRFLLLMGALAGALLTAAWSSRAAPEADLSRLRVAVVDTEEEALRVPPGAQAIVVRDPSGRPAQYPSQTAAGVPVLFPARDGPVSLRNDGTQRAADGRF